MCDYSITAHNSRPAAIGEQLVTHNFGSTVGFIPPGEPYLAVCVLPGTEIGFDEPVRHREKLDRLPSNWSLMDVVFGPRGKRSAHSTAIFRQVNKETTHVHHDGLEFPDSTFVLLTNLIPGQTARVLQLPAQPKTEAEAREQRRVEYAG